MQRNEKMTVLGRSIILVLLLLMALTSLAISQTAEIPQQKMDYLLYSGKFEGQPEPSGEAALVYHQKVVVPNVPWLRLLFADANLGTNSYMIITSQKDRAWQKLDATSLRQWGSSSAYFNGNTIEIELYAAPGDHEVFVMMESLIAGRWGSGAAIESQCGPTDDRIPSNQDATGRLMSIGCTAWIISNGRQVTAGHCLDGSGADVLEFNVPPSTSSGTVQHPGPNDQYSVIISSKVFINGGIGNDFGVFEVYNNTNTGLQPKTAQNAYFRVVQDLTPDSIRITGYGVDYNDPTLNQVQQTHVGPNMGSSGTTMRYQTDTEGGNSGSPVIDEATGFAVGVHTHGGCTTSGGNNSGTSTYHTQFWEAMGLENAIPEPPTALAAYSDYTMPTSMQLYWDDPTVLVTGDTLLPADFSVQIKRDGIWIDSVAGGTQLYMDSGLNDGQVYHYQIYARMDSSGTESELVDAAWICGGSPVPTLPTEPGIRNLGDRVHFSWRNPAANIDGTPMDDFAGLNLYLDSVLVQTFSRTSADTAALDSAVYTNPPAGFHSWYFTAIDNESPQNESTPTVLLITPLNAPIGDNFAIAGLPNPGIWGNANADINERALNPPTGPNSLNLNGKPDGGDVMELHPVDLSAYQGSGIVLSYFYQPQGQGNAPERSDSLLVYFRNDLGNWILVRGYPGSEVQPFQQEIIDLASAPNGGGSYFHSQFQVRLRSIGSPSQFTPNDDWFIDDIYLGVAAPYIAAGTDTVVFDTTYVDSTSLQNLSIQNLGMNPLQVSNVISTNPVFSVDMSSFTVNSFTAQNITVQFQPQQVGVHNGILRFVSNDLAHDTLDVYVRGVGDILTGIGEQDLLPRVFSVSQNYPNPFNPTTRIYYQLPRAGDVELIIYNLLGQEVRRLVDTRAAAGRYSVTWDGLNETGDPVASGIYLYRFRAGDYSRVLKMILMK